MEAWKDDYYCKAIKFNYSDGTKDILRESSIKDTQTKMAAYLQNDEILVGVKCLFSHWRGEKWIKDITLKIAKLGN